jgi:uncharacterized membrane protein YedE/YeeE
MFVENSYNPITAFLAGLCLSSCVTIYYSIFGRVLGISGMIGGILNSPFDLESNTFKTAFIIGLLLVGFNIPIDLDSISFSPLIAITSGVFVGLGTKLGSGCKFSLKLGTSGHGLCGLSRFSPRSFVSVITFMTIGMITHMLMIDVSAIAKLPPHRIVLETDPELLAALAISLSLFFVLHLVKRNIQPIYWNPIRHASSLLMGIIFGFALYKVHF